ncbi:MAG: T9SS type A sorting domain-containing protein [Candidatus Latescibacteria bacterium]|nr:T9SS type A sorting domain-containing protein [Candidatus Latescibacterota bacterium]
MYFYKLAPPLYSPLRWAEFWDPLMYVRDLETNLRRLSAIGFFLLLLIPAAGGAEPFICSGQVGGSAVPTVLAHPKIAQKPPPENQRVLALFARFKGESPDQRQAPDWAAGLFDPEQPGSVAHFYRTMSFGRLKLTGAVAPQRYVSAFEAAAYLAEEAGSLGHFGRFALDILRQADRDIDFSLYDSDGPDGKPNSGDDDGLVDAVFINLLSVPEGFLVNRATGIAQLNLEEPFATNDLGFLGEPILLPSRHGTIQRALTFSEAAGVICHEYGHVLGLPDLFNKEFLDQQRTLPEEDSAGIGRWGLMGWGALGWTDTDGPVALSAWSLERLGWMGPEKSRPQVVDRDTTVVVGDIQRGGAIVKIPLRVVESGIGASEYLLLEQRTRTFYNRNIPAEGLLVWHIGSGDGAGLSVDLVCADGRFMDAGFPLGQLPDGRKGADNLDFWAHERAYTQAHGGNLGDATDPFDGVRFKRLDLDSNPSNNPSDLTPAAATGPSLRMQPQGRAMQVEVRQSRWAGVIRGAVKWSGTVLVDGDIEIAPEGELRIEGAVQVRFAQGDRMRSGLDPDRSELIVRGGLQLVGNAVFAGMDTASQWYGIVFDPFGSSRIRLSSRRYEMHGATQGVLFPRAPRGVPEQTLSALLSQVEGSDGTDAGLREGEELRLRLALSNWSLNFFDIGSVQIGWDNDLVRAANGRNSHNFRIDSSLEFFPGQTLDFLLPPLRLSAEATSSEEIDFVVDIAHFPKPDFRDTLIFSFNNEPFTYVGEETDQLLVPDLPFSLELEPNHPNPFNGSTVIGFGLPQGERVELAVYSMTGQKITTLVEGYRDAGFYTASWDGRDDRLRQMASGIYLFQLRAGSARQIRKLLLLR